jgi:hypothetical protein
MSIIATAAAAAFNAIISPFSPHCRCERAEERAEDVEQDSENGDLSAARRLLVVEEETTTTRTTTTTTTSASTTTTTTTSHSGQKRRRNGNVKESTTHWGGRTRKAKAAMTDDELFEYFQKSLKNLTACGNKNCKCLDV